MSNRNLIDREGRNGSVVYLVGGCCVCIGFAVTIGLLIAVLVEVNHLTPSTPPVEAVGSLKVASSPYSAANRVKAAQAIAGVGALQQQQKRDILNVPHLAAAANFANAAAENNNDDELPELLEAKAAPAKKAGLSLAEQARARAAGLKA